jgi:threonine dehydrogenase-like Zn-dependent dehydrogenase
VIDAVGVDANMPHSGPAAKKAKSQQEQYKSEQKTVAPKTDPHDGNWHPGDAPGIALQWAVEAVSKAGTLSVIGVYPETLKAFPIGAAMFKNITVKMGNCNHRKYIPRIVELVRMGAIDPTKILTHVGPLTGAIEAYQNFDRREPGWIKVMLEPAPAPAVAA